MATSVGKHRRKLKSDSLELASHTSNGTAADLEEQEYELSGKSLDGNDAPGLVPPDQLNSDRHTAAHMFISFVGAGVLGLPYAFMKTGLLGAISIMPFVGASATYAMMLLIDCKNALVNQGKLVRGYGDIGFGVSGAFGSWLVDILLVITQVCFCCAYLLFIGENMHSVLPALNSTEFVLICIPGLSLLVLYRHIKNLSPFALVADIANIIGILVVVSYDVEIFREHELHMDDSLNKITYGIIASQLPYFFGVSIYCYEGVGVILPIEESMQNKQNFRRVLSFTMVLVTLVYTVFGVLGYIAYGPETKEIITLNLGAGVPTKVVKVALSVGLFFTYPLMMFPVFTIMENAQSMQSRPMWVKSVARVCVVFFSVFVALGIPNFGDFISLVGAGACALLALVLPAYFHLRIVKSLSWLQIVIDYLIVFCGSLLGIIGTISASQAMYEKMGP